MRKSLAAWSDSLWACWDRVRDKSRQAKHKKLSKPRSLQVEVLERREMLSIAPLSDERLANSYTAGTQRLYDCTEALAADPSGNYVLTWTSAAQDGDQNGIYAQRFQADGQLIGSEFRANSTTANDQMRSSVAMAADSSALIVWESFGQDGDHSGVYGQRFAADGQPLGSEFHISETTLGYQEKPCAAALADNSWLVVWSGKGPGDVSGIYGRRYAADGTATTGEFRINTQTAYEQTAPAVAALPDGGALVAWESHGNADGDASGIYMQRFNAAGEAVGGEVQVNTTTASFQQSPAIGVGPQGQFVIAWQSNLQDGSQHGIYAQRFNSAGEKVGAELAVNTFTEGEQLNPSVAFNGQGGFAIAFNGKGPGEANGVYVREYAPDGTPLGDAAQINNTTTDAQQYATIRSAGSGYVVAWSGRGIGDSDGVYLRPLGSGPATSGISTINVQEDAPTTNIDLRAAFDDAEDADTQLSFVLTGNTNPGLFSSVTIVDGQLHLSYAPNIYGSAQLTIRGSDRGGLYSETSFAVNVAAVNDAPTTSGIAAVQVDEDAADTAIDLNVSFDDVDNSDSELLYEVIGNTNLELLTATVLSGGQLQLSYLPNAFGAAEVTIRATDPGGLAVTTAFAVTVAAVNDTPTTSGLANVSVEEDAAPTEIHLRTAFADIEDSGDTLTYSVVGNSRPDVVATSVDANGVLTLTYLPDANGTVDLAVRATDSGGLYVDNTFTVNVASVNDAPVIGRLLDAPDPAINGAGLRLEAVEVADDGTVETVAFYRDADHDGVLNTATDQLLGTDSNAADGWGISVSTAGFGSGAQRYFAVATDDQSATSDPATTTGTLGLMAVLDNSDPGYTETGSGWADESASAGLYGNARVCNAGTGANTAQWVFTGLAPGSYEVQLAWTAGTDRASNAPYTISDGAATLGTSSKNQRVAPNGVFDGTTWWQSAGTYQTATGTLSVQLTDNANGVVSADAIRLVSVAPMTLYWDADGNAGNNVPGSGAGLGGSGTWTAGGGNLWYNPFTGQNTSWVNGARAVLTGTGGTVTLSGEVSVDKITVASGNFTLQSGTLNLPAFTGTAIEVTSGTATIQSTLAGPGGLLKSGAGTLVLTGENTFTGGTTISGGTLQIGDGATAGSIVGSVVNNASLKFNRSDAVTFAGDIGGSGSLTKLGAGTLTVSGANTYTGATTVSAGVLKAGSTQAFGTNSAVTLANAAGTALDITGFDNAIGSLTSGGTTGGNVVLGAATLTVGGNNTSPAAYAGVISGIGGGIAKIGTGTLILSGTNTYTGSTAIDAGTLQFNSAAAIGGSGRSVTVAGGATVAAGYAINNAFLNRLAENANAFNINMTAASSNALDFSSSGGANLPNAVLCGAGGLTYSGVLTPGGNTYRLGNLNTSNAFSDTTRFIVSSALSGAGNSLVISGSNFVELTGSLSYKGTTTVNPGAALRIDANLDNIGGGAGVRDILVGEGASFLRSGGAVSNAFLSRLVATTNTFTIYFGNANCGNALDFSGTAGGTYLPNVYLAAYASNNQSFNYTGALTPADNTYRFGGPRGSSSFTVLPNANQLTGARSLVVGGRVQIGAANNFSGDTTINNASILTISGSGSLGSGNYAGAITNNGALLYSSSANQTLSGPIGGPGALTKDTSAASTLTLAGANTYAGTTTVTAGTLSLSGSGTLGNGANSLTLSGGALDLGGTTDRTVGAVSITKAATSGDTMSNGSLVGTSYAVSNTSGNAIVSASLLANGTAGLTKSGSGILTLSGTNTYTGATTVSAGTLSLSGSGTLGNGANNLLLNGGALNLGGTADRTVGAVTISKAAASGDTLSNGGLAGTSYAVVNSSGNAIISASLLANGTAGLTKGSGGTLTLSGANTYAGATTVSSGTLSLSGSGTLGNGTNNLIISGGALNLGATTDRTVGAVSITKAATSGDTVSNGSLTGTSYAVSNTSGNAIVSASLLANGTAGLTKSGVGTLTLSGANTYAGATTVTAGTLALSGSGTLGNGANDLILSGGSLNLGATTDRTVGAVSITQAAASGDTMSNGGLTGTSYAVSNASGNAIVSASLLVNGAVGLTKTGAGTLVLSGANTYAGETTIAGGVLQLAADNALPATAVVRIGDPNFTSGILDLGGHNLTLAGLYTGVEGSGHGAYWDAVVNASETPATLTLNNAADYLYAGHFAGNLSLAKYGAGHFTVGGVSTNSGTVLAYDGTLEVTGCFVADVLAVPGFGNPQLLGKVDPVYWVVNRGMLHGEAGFQHVDHLTTSSEFVLATDWRAAVYKAVSGSVDVRTRYGNWVGTLYFPDYGESTPPSTSDQLGLLTNAPAFLVDTFENLNKAVTDLHGGTDAFDLNLDPNTKLIVLEDLTGKDLAFPYVFFHNDQDYDDAYWVVSVASGDLAIDGDNSSLDGAATHEPVEDFVNDRYVDDTLENTKEGMYIAVKDATAGNVRVPIDIRVNDWTPDVTKVRFVCHDLEYTGTGADSQDPGLSLWRETTSGTYTAINFNQAYDPGNTGDDRLNLPEGGWGRFYVQAERAGKFTIEMQINPSGGTLDSDWIEDIDTVRFTALNARDTCLACQGLANVNGQMVRMSQELPNGAATYSSGNSDGFLVGYGSQLIYTGDNGIAILNGDTAIIFDYVGTSYVQRSPDVSGRATLAAVGNTFTLTDQNGNRTTFSAPSNKASGDDWGSLGSSISVDGTRTDYDYNGAGQLTSLSQTYPGIFNDTVNVAYTYDGNTVTATESHNSSAVRQAVYTRDSAGDLKTVQIKDATGTHVLETTYYRYYSGTYNAQSNPGQAHAVKWLFNAAAYQRLLSEVSNPDSFNDEDLKPYADKYADEYYEYDATGRVSLRRTAGEGCSLCGGQGEIASAYLVSNYADDFNAWRYLTVDTKSDVRTATFSNFAHQTMLVINEEIVTSGTAKRWYDYTRYNDAGQPVLTTGTSGIDLTHTSIGSLDPEGQDWLDLLNLPDDLVGNVNAALDLNASDGLFQVNEYYPNSDPTAPGYLKATYVRKGESGTDIQQDEYSYVSHAGSDGRVSILLAGSTVYPDAVAGNAHAETAATTSYAYTWYDNDTSVQMRSEVVTNPIVIAGNNGSGDPTSETTWFDKQGRPFWSRDAAGYLSYTEYDVITGAVTRSVADVDTDTIVPPTTDFGDMPIERGAGLPAALHLETLYEADALGRTVKVTEPNGSITYTVYNDADHETRTYRGWNASTHTTIGPVEVYRQDSDDNYTESLTYSWTDELPHDETTDAPLGSEDYSDAAATIQSLSRSLMNEAGQATVSRQYFALPIGTDEGEYVNGYSTVRDLGTSGTHYLETDYTFDPLGRLAVTRDPAGTITHTFYDALSRTTEVWVGTDDVPNQDYDSISGPGANPDLRDFRWAVAHGVTESTLAGQDVKMYKVSANVYDSGGIGDGNLTSSISYASASTTYTTSYQYDWRDRMTGVIGPDGVASIQTLDNLGQTKWDRTYANASYSAGVITTSSVNLLSESQSEYDARGRVYQSIVHDVSSNDSLTTNAWYDELDRPVKTQGPDGLIQKTAYNGLGQVSAEYTVSSEGTTNDPWGTTGDTFVSVTEYIYDHAGRSTEVRVGMHTGLSSSDAVSKTWYDDERDGTGNEQHRVTGVSQLQPGSDTQFVLTAYEYDPAGRQNEIRTQAGGNRWNVTALHYDLLGRQTAQSQYVVAGPIGYWKFDDGSGTTPVDSSGYGNDGTFIDEPEWTSAGKYDSAIEFDGTNQVELNNLAVNTAAAAKTTVAFWMKWDGSGSVMMPFGWDGMYDLILIAAGDYSIFAFNTGQNDKLGFYFAASQWSGQWVHVAAVFTNGTPTADSVALFINGQRQTLSVLGDAAGERTVTSTAAVSGWGLYSNYRFHGTIDEVRVYDRQLSAAEVEKVWRESAPDDAVICDARGAVPGPIGYWKFDDGIGTTPVDSSGYGNDGAFVGDPVWTDGQRGGALEFDGDDQVCVEDLDIDTADGAETTVSLWMNWDGNAINTMPFAWSGAYGLWIWAGDPVGCIGFRSTVGGDMIGITFDKEEWTNTWIHVAAVFTNDTPDIHNVQLYINGQQQQLSLLWGTPVASAVSSEAFISGWGESNYYRFGGAIDDVRIYDRALSAAAVQEIMGQSALGDVPITRTRYDDAGRVAAQIDPLGNVTEYGYDDFGRQNKAVAGSLSSPLGPYALTTYDRLGNVLFQESYTAAGNLIAVTENVYDATTGRLSEVKRGTTRANAETVTRYWYDTDYDGVPSDNDDTGRMTAVDALTASDSLSTWARTLYGYDGYGRQCETVSPDPDGSTTTLHETRTVQSYDSAGRLEHTRVYAVDGTNDGKGSLIAHSQNVYGAAYYGLFLTEIRQYKINEDGSENTTDHLDTSYAYGDYGRLVKTTNPDGSFTKTRYSLGGTVLSTYLGSDEGSTTDPAGTIGDTIVEETDYQYDNLGNVTLTVQRQRHDGAAEDVDQYHGIAMSVDEADLSFSQAANTTAVSVGGAYFLRNGLRPGLGAFGSGIPAPIGGSGYIMYTAEVRGVAGGRFNDVAGASEHLVAVKYDSGWYYWNGTDWNSSFTAASTDILVAQATFATASAAGVFQLLDKTRDSYSAAWYDALGRTVTTADYGTNDGTAVTERPTTVPTWDNSNNSNPDGAIVTAYGYDGLGRQNSTTDPLGHETRTFFDSLGRTIRSVQNYQDGDPATPKSGQPFSTDQDLTTEYGYNGMGLLETQTAVNPIGYNVAAEDISTTLATGSGYYLMYSAASLRSRFGWTGADSRHFVVVQYSGSQWQYENASNEFTPFTRQSSDVLVASIDFGTPDVISAISPQDGDVQGIQKGYLDGTIVFDWDSGNAKFTVSAGYFVDELSEQTTTYVYSGDLSTDAHPCPVPRNDLLRATIKPDSSQNKDDVKSVLNGGTGTHDFVEYTYHANGSLAGKTDQRGVTHTYDAAGNHSK